MVPSLLESQKIEGRSDDDTFYFKKTMAVAKMTDLDFYSTVYSLCRKYFVDYQVTQLTDGSITIALSHRTEPGEQAIFAQFELLAQQKQFILPSIHFRSTIMGPNT